jgi:hypothetical protein
MGESFANKTSALARPDDVLRSADLLEPGRGKSRERLLGARTQFRAPRDTKTPAEPNLVAKLTIQPDDKEGWFHITTPKGGRIP